MICVSWEDWHKVFSQAILHDCHLYLDFYLREEGQASFFFFFYAYAPFFSLTSSVSLGRPLEPLCALVSSSLRS